MKDFSKYMQEQMLSGGDRNDPYDINTLKRFDVTGVFDDIDPNDYVYFGFDDEYNQHLYRMMLPDTQRGRSPQTNYEYTYTIYNYTVKLGPSGDLIGMGNDKVATDLTYDEARDVIDDLK